MTYVVCCTFPSTLLWPVWNVNGLKPLIPWHHVVTGKTEEDLCWLKHEKWRFSLNGHEMKSSCCHQYILNICTQKRFLDSTEGLRATSRFCAILLRWSGFFFYSTAKNLCPVILFYLCIPYLDMMLGVRLQSYGMNIQVSFRPTTSPCFQIHLCATHFASISWITKPLFSS